jgi:choline-glycine betaine transporter
MRASYALIGICQDARVLSRWYVLLVFALLVLIVIVGFVGC